MMQIDNIIKQLLSNEFEPSKRKGAVLWVKAHDVVNALGGNTVAADEEKVRVRDDKIYRVCIDGRSVSIVCFGMDLLDPQAEGYYDSVDDLPKWVQDRLAVLMITPIGPPTKEVANVGRRIEEDLYWVYAP